MWFLKKLVGSRHISIPPARPGIGGKPLILGLVGRYTLIAFLLTLFAVQVETLRCAPTQGGGAVADPERSDPAKPSEEENRKKVEDIVEEAERVLRESFCKPVPDPKMLAFHGKKTSLRRVLDSKGTIVFLLVNEFDLSVRWTKMLAEGEWPMPEPYKKALFLLEVDSLGALTPYLKKLGNTYLVQAPLPGYLEVHAYPTALYVSGDGLLEGYQSSPDLPPVMKPGGCHPAH